MAQFRIQASIVSMLSHCLALEYLILLANKFKILQKSSRAVFNSVSVIFVSYAGVLFIPSPVDCPSIILLMIERDATW